jgi:hypothetical protein
MQPVLEIDAVLVLATALSAKRRPASLAEVIAAADVIEGFIPYEMKLLDALRRVSSHGLIVEQAAGYTLNQVAQQMVASLPTKLEMPEQVAAVMDKLAADRSKPTRPAIEFSAEQYREAVAAHRSLREVSGRNVLMPKPKPDRYFKVDGKWQRASGTPAARRPRKP